MSQLYALSGQRLDGAEPGANHQLVAMLRLMLAEAEAGRLVVFAGVVGSTERGKLDLRFATHTNNWEVHDRLLARVGALRTMMEQDLLSKMAPMEPLDGGGDDGSGAA